MESKRDRLHGKSRVLETVDMEYSYKAKGHILHSNFTENYKSKNSRKSIHTREGTSNKENIQLDYRTVIPHQEGLEEFEDKQSPKFLTEKSFYVDVVSDSNIPQTEDIEKRLESHGAKIYKNLMKKNRKIEHFIFKNGCYKTIEFAKKYRIPVLKYQWYLECMKENKWLDFDLNPEYLYSTQELIKMLDDPALQKQIRRVREDDLSRMRKKMASIIRDKKEDTIKNKSQGSSEKPLLDPEFSPDFNILFSMESELLEEERMDECGLEWALKSNEHHRVIIDESSNTVSSNSNGSKENKKIKSTKKTLPRKTAMMFDFLESNEDEYIIVYQGDCQEKEFQQLTKLYRNNHIPKKVIFMQTSHIRMSTKVDLLLLSSDIKYDIGYTICKIKNIPTVSQDWVLRSIEKKEIQPISEKKVILLAPEPVYSNLFMKKSFLLFRSKNNPNTSRVIDIIERCGGTICKDTNHISHSADYGLVLREGLKNWNKAIHAHQQSRFGIPILNIFWLLDSVAHNKVKNEFEAEYQSYYRKKMDM